MMKPNFFTKYYTSASDNPLTQIDAYRSYYTTRHPSQQILKVPARDNYIDSILDGHAKADAITQLMNCEKLENHRLQVLGLKKQVFLKRTLLRAVRASYEQRRIRGGAVIKSYLLTMTVVLRNANDPTATYPHPTTYTYKSASCELRQNTIDDAVDQLIQDMGEADYYSKYDAAKLVHVRNENIAHRPYEEVSLRDLPLYGINRIGDRQCPDDKLMSTTQNQCVIDGLFAFLYVHYSDKRLTRSKLISELGSANPSINQLEAWVTNEEYQY